MKFSRKMLLSVLAGFMIIMATDAFAGNPIKKLGRGIANIGFSLLEVPLQVYDVTQEEGGIAGITYGPLKGVAYCVARIGVGVVEVITFPIPLPGCPDDPRDEGWGYGPIMRPEWVIDPAHNAYNIFYNDQENLN